MNRLSQILRSKPMGTRIIIFCSTKRMCDQLAGQLGREFRAVAIHGDKKQQVCLKPRLHHADTCLDVASYARSLCFCLSPIPH